MEALTETQENAKKMYEKQETKHSRLCEHFLGLRPGKCRHAQGRDCDFAHCLAELCPPNESASAKWTKLWENGEVDHYFLREQNFSSMSH